MGDIALLLWNWHVEAPLHTGYGANLAEFAGKRKSGARSSVNLETHTNPDDLQPAFLASSVKGVFRSTAAWLVERTARQLGETQFVTYDYSESLEDRQQWHKSLVRKGVNRLCPVSELFGGSGFIGAKESSGAQRLRSPITFSFTDNNDAYYAQTKFSPDYLFGWQIMRNKGKKLKIEQLLEPEGVTLIARIDPANDYRIASAWLTADLISSGFFRFGRFVSRGYGIVRLQPKAYLRANLDDLLSQETLRPVPLSVQDGYTAAQTMLKQNPLQIVSDHIQNWLDTSKAAKT